MAGRIEARLRRLEADAERPALRIRVVWDGDDEDDEDPDGLVIRLRWANDEALPEKGEPWTPKP